VVSILILAILLGNSIGFYVYYAIQLNRIHTEMRAALQFLPDHELQKFTLTTKAFKDALVDEGEIKIQGKMYDIARVSASGDRITLYAKHDEKEDDLLALINDVISKPLPDDKAIPASIVGFLTLVFVKPINEYAVWISVRNADVETTHLFSIQTMPSTPDSPPPWA
jgi:hypothetical protein